MKKIGIYPGNFQPADRSHLEAYKKLKSLVGSDTFIATTDREPIPEAPLNFGDKEQIWVRHGVPASHIIKVQTLPTDDAGKGQEWRPQEILHKFSANRTVVVIALNEKEASLFSVKKKKTDGTSGMSTKVRRELNELYEELSTPDVVKQQSDNEDPEDVDSAFEKKNKQHQEQSIEVWLNSKNEPSYLQPYKGNEKSLKPFEEHAYVIIVDDSKIQGHAISTTNIRNTLGSDRYNDEQKKKFFRWVFGWFDVGLYQLLVYKFRNAHQVVYADDEPSNQSSTNVMTKTTEPRPAVTTPNPQADSSIYNKNRKLQEIVYTILKELVDEDYSSTTDTTTTPNLTNGMSDTLGAETKSAAQQAKDRNDQRIALVKQKKELEANDKQDKQQRDNYATTVKNYDRFKKKNNRDAIDSVNKQLSSPTPPTSTIA